MPFAIQHYENLINEFQVVMLQYKDSASVRIETNKWTLQEMVGHLIDSASNNHQRFIRLQINQTIEFPGYNEEEWKNVSDIGRMDYEFLVSFWKSYNVFIVYIIKNIKDEDMKNYWKINDEGKSLNYLVEDYFRHMKWHKELFEKRVEEIKEYENRNKT